MNNLTVIESGGLIKIYQTDKGEKVVNARELHQGLGSKQDFSTWIKKRLSECDALENEDYIRLHKKMEANNATIVEYILKLDIAKEMAMLERNEKGKEYRRYFIEVEKKYKQSLPSGENLIAMAVIEAHKMLEQKDKLIEEMKPHAEFGQAIECSKSAMLVRDYVKLLANAGIDIKESELFRWLKDKKYIYREDGRYKPYKRFVEMRVLQVKEHKIKNMDKASFTTKITGKGQKYFYEKLKNFNRQSA